MKKKQESSEREGEEFSAEKALKNIIKKKKAEKAALIKIMDSLEKKRKPNT